MFDILPGICNPFWNTVLYTRIGGPFHGVLIEKCVAFTFPK